MATERTGTPVDGLDTLPATLAGIELFVGRGSSRRDRSGQLVADRYRIVRRLGEGGMGSVWLAVDSVLARTVALKELKQPRGSASEAVPEGSALREARAAAAVSHRGVVQIYDVVVSGDQEWIVMEALAGTTLTQAIRETGALPIDTLVSIGLRLLEALEALHREGVIHGDIKPGNVQLVATGRPVLTDFGLASRETDRNQGTSPYGAGSPPYMAPETIRTGVRSPATDLFALGATLYEAAVGRRPFDDATPAATAIAVLHHCPKPALPGTPLGQVIDGLLVKDRHHRLGHGDAYRRLKAVESDLLRATTDSSPALLAVS
jgi:eukaryotic-like serine/threonine-protein kinase